jgi:hypothetical protein
MPNPIAIELLYDVSRGDTIVNTIFSYLILRKRGKRGGGERRRGGKEEGKRGRERGSYK